ncbi:MAG: hypothetical protein IJQ06_00750 [Paludibacteraceae bacterium]|nr:hypothetical protein [Paludibacteraceae bacterium]
MKVGSKARKTINGWLDKIQDGDRISFNHNEAVIRNGSGCELDRISLIH